MPNYKKSPLDPDNIDKELDYFLKYIDAERCCKEMVETLNRRMLSSYDDYLFFSNFFKGSVIGGAIDNCMVTVLNNLMKLFWRHGLDATEVDMVCQQNSRINFELKTSSTEKRNKEGNLMTPKIPFAKSNAGNKDSNSRKYNTDRYEYCLFMQYHMPKRWGDKFKVLRVYVGMYKPSDLRTYDDGWQNCSSAMLPVDMFRNQFRLVYGEPEP